MISIRRFMKIVEDAGAGYPLVVTPFGDGSVIKIEKNLIYVDLGPPQGVKEFTPSQIRRKTDLRPDNFKPIKKDYSFSPDQLAAGRRTSVLAD